MRQELMLGLYFRDTRDNTIVQVTEADFHPSIYEYFEPIKINHEWLEAFDFVKDLEDAVEIKITHWSKSIINGDSDHSERLVIITPFAECHIGEVTDEDIYILNRSIEYVHQLQTLYFALTGKMLKR